METVQTKPKVDFVKVRVLTQLLIARDRTTDSETYAKPGDIIELPRAEAERLAGRTFEGYRSTRDSRWRKENGVEISGGAMCSPMPDHDGQVRDPQVEILR
jgi:hypothetical protein